MLPAVNTSDSGGVEEGKVFIKSAPLILHVPAALYPANPIMLLTSDSAGKVANQLCFVVLKILNHSQVLYTTYLTV
jgi:hypothetical protein